DLGACAAIEGARRVAVLAAAHRDLIGGLAVGLSIGIETGAACGGIVEKERLPQRPIAGVGGGRPGKVDEVAIEVDALAVAAAIPGIAPGIEPMDEIGRAHV